MSAFINSVIGSVAATIRGETHVADGTTGQSAASAQDPELLHADGRSMSSAQIGAFINSARSSSATKENSSDDSGQPDTRADGAKKPKHSRTPAAKAERHKKKKLKRQVAAAAAAAPEEQATAAPTARERALERALALSEKLLRLARRSKRRDEKTARQRGQQLERRDSKAAKAQKRKRGAKLERALAGAARRERGRINKGTRPVGEALHTGERTHKRKLTEAEARQAQRRRLNSYKQT